MNFRTNKLIHVGKEATKLQVMLSRNSLAIRKVLQTKNVGTLEDA